jgi:gamma-tubulin complex component 3
MSSRSQRVNKGINSLVERLHVVVPGEDVDSAEERQNNAVAFVTEVLQRSTPYPRCESSLLTVF